MSNLVVIGFDNQSKAGEVLKKLGTLQKEHLIDLEDACIVTRDENGKNHVTQAINLTATGAASGSFWGLLIGLLFMQPLLGMLVGAASGAISGSLVDFGINDDFIKDLGKTLTNDSSALFILVRKATPDKVIAELEGYNGQILHTSLSIKDETALKAALDKARQQTAATAQA